MYNYKSYNKYRNTKCLYKNMKFDSIHEKDVYIKYEHLERLGNISLLKRQVKFELIPSQYDNINGKKKCIERSCNYIADIVYFDSNGEKVVVDCKSEATKTPEYIIKRKLMLYVYNIKIIEE